MKGVPRLLVLSTSLPGTRHGGGVVQEAILRRYPKDRYVCFAVRPPDGWPACGELPEPLRGVPCLFGPLVPWVNLRGARFYMPLLRALGFRLVARHRVRQAVAFGRRHRAEMVWGELQGDALVLAQAVAEGLGVPLAGTVWDDPAGWLADGGCDRLSRRLLLRRFREALKAARSLSTAGEAMQRAYHRDYGVRSVILRHGFDAPARHQKSGNDGAITVGFVGSLYGRDAWSAFLSAAARLNASHRLRPIRLRVFGAAAFPYGCNGVQVDFRGWQPAEEMLREIALTDFCYLPYWFDPAKRRHVELSFPNKFETYLAAGRPVLFHGPSYAGIAEAVKQYGVGMCVHSLNEEEMTAALERLIRDKRLRESFGLAALAAFHAQFNATVMMEQFAELIGVDPGLLQQQRSATVPCAADTHE